MTLLEKLFGPRPACKCGRRMHALRRAVPIFVCVCGAMKVGKNTVTLDGLANLIRWSASGVPTVLGEVGMDIATGRMQQFVGGAAQNVANLADILAGTGSQIVESVAAQVLAGGAQLLTGMSITPAAGTYMVWLSVLCTCTLTDTESIDIRAGAVVVAASIKSEECNAGGNTLSTMARVTVNGAQAIEGFITRAGNAASAGARQLMIAGTT